MFLEISREVRHIDDSVRRQSYRVLCRLQIGIPRKWPKFGKVCQIYVFRNISVSWLYRGFGPVAKLKAHSTQKLKNCNVRNGVSERHRYIKLLKEREVQKSHFVTLIELAIKSCEDYKYVTQQNDRKLEKCVKFMVLSA